MVCVPASSLVCSGGWRCMDIAASSLISAAQRFGWWCERGKVHESPCLCCSVEPIQRQYYTGGYHFGEISGSCWSRYICCVSAWRSACSWRSFCELFRKWLTCQARGIPHIWYPVDEALHPADFCVCGWEPVLNEGNCSEPVEGAENRDWMASLPALRKAIVTIDLSRPGLVEMVANIIGVWQLVISYLKETIRKDDWESLLVRF